MAGKNLFGKVPYVSYDILLNNKTRVVKNIFKVAQVVEKYQNNISSSYEYIIQEDIGDKTFTNTVDRYGNIIGAEIFGLNLILEPKEHCLLYTSPSPRD